MGVNVYNRKEVNIAFKQKIYNLIDPSLLIRSSLNEYQLMKHNHYLGKGVRIKLDIESFFNTFNNIFINGQLNKQANIDNPLYGSAILWAFYMETYKLNSHKYFDRAILNIFVLNSMKNSKYFKIINDQITGTR